MVRSLVAAPVFVLGVLALVPGFFVALLAISGGLADFAISSPFGRTPALVLAFSLTAGALCLVPAAKRWLFARRRERMLEWAFVQFRLILLVAVLWGQEAFLADLSAAMDVARAPGGELIAGLGCLYFMAVIFPGWHARALARDAGAPASAEGRAARALLVEARMPSSLRPPPPRPIVLTRIGVGLLGGVFVAAVALWVYGTREAWFAPSAELRALFDENRADVQAAAAAFGLGMVLLFCADPGYRARRGRFWFLIVPPAGLCLGLILGFLAEGAFTRGAPAFHSLLLDPVAQEVAPVIVVGRGEERRRRGCARRVLVTGEDLIGPSPLELCGADAALFDTIAQGQEVRLLGYWTRHGFRYERILPGLALD